MDKSVLKNVDFCLLLTFISFFLFTGNLGNIPAIRDTLQELVNGRELLIGIASLISYKILANKYNEKKGKYFQCFTIINIIFLIILIAFNLWM